MDETISYLFTPLHLFLELLITELPVSRLVSVSLSISELKHGHDSFYKIIFRNENEIFEIVPPPLLIPDRSSSFYRSLFINSRNSDFARLKIISNSESRIYYWPSVKKLEIRLIDEYPCLQGIITNSCRKWRGWTILLVAGLDMILLGSCLCQMVKRSRRAFFLDLPRL